MLRKKTRRRSHISGVFQPPSPGGRRKNNPLTLPSQREAFVLMANRKLAKVIVEGAREAEISESRWINEMLCEGFGIPEEDR